MEWRNLIFKDTRGVITHLVRSLSLKLLTSLQLLDREGVS